MARHRRARYGIALSLLLGLAGAFGNLCVYAADEIQLNDGRVVIGSIVETTDSYVVVRTTQSEFRIDKSRIVSIKQQREMTKEEIEGDMALEAGQLEKALALYRAALQLEENQQELERKIDKVQELIKEREEQYFGEALKEIDQLTQEGSLDIAEDRLLKILNLVPPGPTHERLEVRRAKIHYQKALDYLNRVDYLKAEEELRRAISIRDQFFPAHLKLAELLSKLAPTKRAAVQEYLKGLEYGADSLSEEELCEYHFSVASLYYELGEYLAAIEHYRIVADRGIMKTLQSKIMMAEAYNKLADDAAEQGDASQAIAYLQQAVKVQPSSKESWFKMGQFYLKQNKYKEAIGQFEEALRIDNRIPNAHYYLAMCYQEQGKQEQGKPEQGKQEQGKQEQALRELDSEVLYNPTNYNAVCMRGEIYLAGGKYEMAKDDFEKARTINDQKFRAYLGLGKAYLRLKDLPSAEENLNRVREIAPRHTEATLLLGKIYREWKRYDDARKLFDEVVETLKRYELSLSAEDKEILTDALNERGAIALLVDRPRTAIDDFEEALRYNPDNPQTYSNLGQAYTRLGRIREAERQYMHAIELDPQNPDYYLGLGIIYHNYLKQLDQAVEYYTKYILLGGRDVLTVNKWIEECGGTPVDLAKIKQ
jgi:tetratricopeptide (TPR) repeat protein